MCRSSWRKYLMPTSAPHIHMHGAHTHTHVYPDTHSQTHDIYAHTYHTHTQKVFLRKKNVRRVKWSDVGWNDMEYAWDSTTHRQGVTHLFSLTLDTSRMCPSVNGSKPALFLLAKTSFKDISAVDLRRIAFSIPVVLKKQVILASEIRVHSSSL